MSARLVSRRGSSSAPDPFNLHADVNLKPDRTSSSTLTIVPVPASPVPDDQHRPSSPGHPHRKSFHHRRISLPSPTAPDAQGRLSFAFSTFSGRPASPTGSPSSSPRLSGKPRLTPDQLVDLARQATNRSASHLTSTFTPLPDDVYLPFLHRPSEVAALISHPPDAKLFLLLAQTFPIHKIENNSIAPLPSDPTCWTYSQLICHLTQIDRDLVPDFLWAVAARKCIFSHSELIWERVKGSLGIPPELDIDVQFLDDDQESPPPSPHEPAPDADQVGHWDSAVLDSPLLSKAIMDDFTHSDSDHVIIEPLLAPSPGTVTLTQSYGLGLGNIVEDAEEEEEEEEVPNQADQHNNKDKDFIDPSKIQGLRITTSSLPVTSTQTPPHSSIDTPFSPSAPADASIPRNREHTYTHSRSSSFSSIGIGPFQRSESTGDLSALWKSGSEGGSVSGHLSDGGEGPLFPGNFARLGLASRGSALSER